MKKGTITLKQLRSLWNKVKDTDRAPKYLYPADYKPRDKNAYKNATKSSINS